MYVKNEFFEYLSKGTKNKHLAQAQFDETVDSGAYFGSVMDGGAKSCNLISSTRGVRGYMDRFIVNLDDDDEDVRVKAVLQCSVLHNKEGFFGFNQAKLTFDK
ncbi:hypothetical protein PanWU01x14_194690 [Parasponia andersonii]|uniref:Uncharacterized protein n=1 Tax=Parasponia andersonii TaxID=3476 RepID=A0A2P5C0E0_PARAD|nr:hypothetical protein PanWU01x14_194690 [Parasponia andersonii]